MYGEIFCVEMYPLSIIFPQRKLIYFLLSYPTDLASTISNKQFYIPNPQYEASPCVGFIFLLTAKDILLIWIVAFEIKKNKLARFR